MRRVRLTAVVEKDGDWYVAQCPELDIASQGITQNMARDNLAEAVQAFLEAASEQELRGRLSMDRRSGSFCE